MVFRRDAALRIRSLEEERAFAYRRYNLMQAISSAMVLAEGEEIAVANAFAALRARLGWHSDSEAQAEVMTRFSPVALALFRTQGSHDGETADLAGKALGDFERGYAETRGSSFWTLFEQQMPDTPRVDF